jgi:excinuclease ABC subunit A
MDKPEVDSIEGIPPAIAIEQKNHVRTTRSTVGTLTEINDYLKLLFPRLATATTPTPAKPSNRTPPNPPPMGHRKPLRPAGFITFPIPVPPGTPRPISSPSSIPRLPPHPPRGRNHPHRRKLERGIHSTRHLHPPGPPHPRQSQPLPPPRSPRSRLPPRQRPRHHLRGWDYQSQPVEGTTCPFKSFSTTWHNPPPASPCAPPPPPLFLQLPLGACPKCRGFGRIIGLDLEKAVPDPTLSIAQGAIKPFQGERGDECQRDLVRCCKERGIDIKTPGRTLRRRTGMDLLRRERWLKPNPPTSKPSKPSGNPATGMASKVSSTGSKPRPTRCTSASSSPATAPTPPAPPAAAAASNPKPSASKSTAKPSPTSGPSPSPTSSPGSH